MRPFLWRRGLSAALVSVADVLLDVSASDRENHTLSVWSANADGVRSGNGWVSVAVDMLAPESQLDEPAEITFH